MEIKQKKWKPGQLVTIDRRIFRAMKNRPPEHPFFGKIWRQTPCIKCLGVNKGLTTDICTQCVQHCVKDVYLQELHPKRPKGE